ncbi:MAG: type I DNA topoisomerase [Deltaproteobacteria bacterium]|nr:type I DNA topoisomerase [Deltaproteobacteria bacterium]
MGKSLLIVESPAKAKTIVKYLGKDFEVKASVGHVKDLPPKELGVDVEHGFEPKYVTIKGKDQVLKDLKKASAKSDFIYLATDPDREGEAIAWHIALELDDKKTPIRRVLFHELTQRAILEAMDSPKELDERRFNSQQARRIMDRLVGYQISPLLWDKVKRGLSAGRVQSVTVRIITEREREIQAFKKEEYWSVTASLTGTNPPPFLAKLTKHLNKKITIPNQQAATEIVESLQNAGFTVSQVKKTERQRKPLAPFTTSKLQQDAYNKLNLPTKQTMYVAQNLYEGIELGNEGSVGLITYMRTDSTRVSNEAISQVRDYIKATLGSEFLPNKPHAYSSGPRAQEAHEAIRPTSVNRRPEDVKPYLNKNQLALYTLIWNRFVASQMRAAIIDVTSVDITAGDYLFHAAGSVVRFPGYMTLYREENGEKMDKDLLPELAEGDVLKQDKLEPKQHFTQPPPRFTEASLVKELEENGIGRPSTYAAILSTIQEKKYVVKNKGNFFPTVLGFITNDLLVKSFPDILNVEFTAKMEDNLDRIEDGSADWQTTLNEFHQPFSQRLDLAKKEMAQVKVNGLETDIVCEKCGKKMAIKFGKNGEFLACTGYPDCRNTSDFTYDEEGKIVPMKAEEPDEEVVCEKCGAPMAIKKGRFGPFLACTGYPECKNTKPIGNKGVPAFEPEMTDLKCEKCGGNLLIKMSRQGTKFLACQNYPKCKNTRPLPTGIPCPEPGCGGDLSERSSKRGKFYGCSRYPDCKFMVWGTPVKESCPECGSPIMLEKNYKKTGPTLACPIKGCNHKRPLGPEKTEEPPTE